MKFKSAKQGKIQDDTALASAQMAKQPQHASDRNAM